MRWWVGASLVYLTLIASALALALSPYPGRAVWGIEASTNLTLVWFDPANTSEVVFALQNGTIVQFGRKAYWIPVSVRAACSLGRSVVLAGSYRGSPTLVFADPHGAEAEVLNASGTLTAVSCSPQVAAAGAVTGLISPPYRPLILSGELAFELNETVMFEPVWAYGADNTTFAAFGSNYYVEINSTGAYIVYAPDYVDFYVATRRLVAGEMVLNSSQLPFVSLTSGDQTYVLSSNGYVQVVQPDLNSLSLYVRPLSGWALLVYLTASGPGASTTAVLDYPFSLSAAFPYEGGVEIVGAFYPTHGSAQIGLYINGTATGYLMSGGSVIGWTSSSRPASLTPSAIVERRPFQLSGLRVAASEVSAATASLSAKPVQPINVRTVSLGSGVYDRSLSYSVDAVIIATAIVAFVRRS